MLTLKSILDIVTYLMSRIICYLFTKILKFKAHKEILYFNFFLYNFFYLHLCYPFDEIIIKLKKTTGMYFSVIPDNAQDRLRS